MANEKKQDVSRRDFIRGAAKAAGVTVGTAATIKQAQAQGQAYKSILPQTIMGANEKIRTGHIGVGGMGRRNLGEFVLGMHEELNVEPIAICDLAPPQVDRAAGMVESVIGKKPSTHTYLEEVIANKDVDACVICTPDHWHTIPTLMASDAGKDIYTEKPLCTTIIEGITLVDTIKKNNTVFQAGTMQRSGEQFQEAVEVVRSGYLGKIARVETWSHDGEPVEGIGDPPDQDAPPWLDWERYIGWTKPVPFNKNRYIYNFRWFLDYSGGKVTDWGAHLIDIALWAMGEDKKPKTIASQGGKYVLTDNRTTPDTLEVVWEYDDYILSFSNKVYSNTRPYPHDRDDTYGIAFHGTLGTLLLTRNGYTIVPMNRGCEAKERGGAPMNQPHWKNWVHCIRTREKPICDIETIFNTTLTCHLGTITYRTGHKLEWDSETLKFTGPSDEIAKAANGFAYQEYQNGFSLKAPYYNKWKV